MNIRLMIQKTKPNNAGYCPIYIEVSINPKNGKKEIIRIPTGEKIQPRFWGKKGEVTSSYVGYKDINAAILGKYLEAQQVIRANEGATLSDIKAIYDKKKNKQVATTLIQFYEQYREFKAKKITPNGMKSIIALHKMLVAYEKEVKKTLYPNQLDIHFYDAFCEYFSSKLSSNTIHKQIEIFRVFLNYLTDRGYNDKLDYKKWKLPKLIPTQIITLTKSELDNLCSLPINNTRLERVRDMFVVLCTTGLRFEDGLKLRPQHFSDDKIIQRASKTQEIITIPLNKYSRLILERDIIINLFG